MSASWVAGGVRAQAMGRRRLGTPGVRALARSGSLAAAVEVLSASPYRRRVAASAGLAGAQRAVLETLLWNLRVLAGWLPSDGVRSLRLLAAWFEIANVDERLAELAGGRSEPPFQLGVLGSAWPRLADTASPGELRSRLGASVWGDPGADSAWEISLWMRISWAQRVATGVEAAIPWALGAVALMVAGHLGSQRPLPERAAQGIDRLIGRDWVRADGIAALRNRLPAKARWALDGFDDARQLWRAEAGWWRRLEADGWRLLGGGFGPARPVGAAALLAADAWRVRAALELAARGSTLEGDLDVLA